MSDTVRSFGPAGIEQVAAWILGGAQGEVPRVLLDDAALTEPVPGAEPVEERSFSSGYELGLYLAAALKGCERSRLRSDNGLWVWLTLYYFDALCPADVAGRRKVLGIEHYIPSAKWSKAYRHIVRSATLLVAELGDLARILLISNRGGVRHSDFLEQLGSRQEIITNRSLIEIASILYFDSKTGKVRSGATDRKRPGNLRRLVTVAQQLELTYDLHLMKAEMIGGRLPSEFGRWGPESK